MMQSKIYGALSQGLEAAGALQTPADVHGTLTGLLCANENADATAALDDDATDTLREALSALREMTLEGLFDPDLGFTPLLPDDDEAALDTRVKALAGWCGGFLYGMASEQGNGGELDLANLSPELREVVNDLSQLARVGLTAEDNDAESAEGDYAELVEYVRVGVQMIFMELRPPRSGPETREQLH